jgi:hypothetical protein
MAKRTKKAKPAKRRGREMPGLVINILPPPPPSDEDFERARELLGRRADALIMDLAKRYQADKAAELTIVLDALESVAELERLTRGPE